VAVLTPRGGKKVEEQPVKAMCLGGDNLGSKEKGASEKNWRKMR